MARVVHIEKATGRICGVAHVPDPSIQEPISDQHEVVESDEGGVGTHAFIDGEVVELPPAPVTPEGYAAQRRREYPPMEDLADALYWQQCGSSKQMLAYLAACTAVKAKFPK